MQKIIECVVPDKFNNQQEIEDWFNNNKNINYFKFILTPLLINTNPSLIFDLLQKTSAYYIEFIFPKNGSFDLDKELMNKWFLNVYESKLNEYIVINIENLKNAINCNYKLKLNNYNNCNSCFNCNLLSYCQTTYTYNKICYFPFELYNKILFSDESTHTKFLGKGFWNNKNNKYDLNKLILFCKSNLDIIQVDFEEIYDLVYISKFSQGFSAQSFLDFIEHYERVYNANLISPIIISERAHSIYVKNNKIKLLTPYKIIDGFHRIVKAYFFKKNLFAYDVPKEILNEYIIY